MMCLKNTTSRSRRRGITTGLGAILLSLITVACGAGSTTEKSSSPSPGDSAGSSTGPLLVVINRGATEQYFIDLQSSFRAEVKRLGGTAKVYDAKEDPGLTISSMNDAVSAGAKGIAITAQSSDLGPALSKIAKSADVPYLATDVTQKDQSGNEVPFVGFNGKAMGTAVGNELTDLLGKAAWLNDPSKQVGALSVEAQSISVCQDRTNASKDILEKSGFPGSRIFQVPYDGSTASGQSAAGPVITAHPTVTNWVIFSCNDEGVLGAINALTTAGVNPANVIGVGIGAYEACKPWVAKQPTGFKAALFFSGADVGKAAADALWDNITKNVPLPKFTAVDTAMVLPSNFDKVLDPLSLENCRK